jgi:pimeloyl-ACP methyl ester carboxylesterase
MGLSDAPARIDVDDWVEDTRAVLDAVGSERPFVLGISAGAPTATLFAARNPERTRALILSGGYPRLLRSDEYTFGFDEASVDAFIDKMRAQWGTGFGLSVLAPSLQHDPATLDFWARLQSRSASPSAAANFLHALAAVDVTDALPRVSAPTLLVHAQRDANTPIEGARICRDLIPNARLVELDSDVHLIWVSDVIDDITDEIEAFIAATVGDATTETVLTTILAVTPAGALALCSDGVKRHGGQVVAASNVATFERPAHAVECALGLVRDASDDRVAALDGGVGVGVHSGECRLTGDRVEGYAVNLATHLAANAKPGEALVSQTVRDLLAGSPLDVAPQGCVRLSGDTTEWAVFTLR